MKEKVASGLYNNASEVIREALRLLLEQDGHSASDSGRRVPAKKTILRRLAALEKPLRDRGINSLALFGSVLRGTAGPHSDIDVLIDVAPDVRFSLLDLVNLRDFLQDQLGHRVDVVTRSGLDPLIRDRVIHAAERIF